MAGIHDLSATELAAEIQAGKLSPIEVVDHFLTRIDRLNAQVGAFITVTEELARAQARAAEHRLREAGEGDELPPLLGVPVPIKDLNFVAGVRTTFGSMAYVDSVAPEDDHVTAAVRRAGGVIIGKTNTPEFGLPCYTENAVAPAARTPFDLARSAGGSSGGAAAAVSSGLAPLAQGSDGGGSIRIPASVCGLFGLKPTRGRVSNGPLLPDLDGLAVNGPLARTVADAALLLDVLTGNQPGDRYRLPPPATPFRVAVTEEPGRLRIGRYIDSPVPGTELHPDCRAAYEDASRLLAELGHDVEDIPPPVGADLLPAFETLWAVMSTLMPVDPAREEQLLPLTRWLRARGAAVTAPSLVLAQAELQITMRGVLARLDAYDAVLTPTLAQPPRPIGWFHDQEPAENFERQKRFTPWTAFANLSGQPSATLPLYWNDAGLPIGVMLTARLDEEARLLALCAQIERARPWRERTPPLW